MKRIFRIFLVLVVLGLLGFAVYYFIKSNNKPPEVYAVKQAAFRDVERKTVATGKVVPLEEVEVKPQVTGIIDRIYIKEAQYVKRGQLIAKIKVVPDEQSMNSAMNRIKNAEITLRNAQVDYDRNKPLLDKAVISAQDFQSFQLQLDQAKQELENAKSDLKVIQEGSARGDKGNTNIRALTGGTVLEIPVEEGDQVIQSNTFNDGTTVATIADMSRMIFEGQVDEAEVGKLYLGMPLEITLGALQDEKIMADLNFIAPKGTEEEGAVQFKIEGDLKFDSETNIRAGYSANASIVLDKKDSVLTIEEALIQFDPETDQAYVEIETGDQVFERRDVKTGISDGLFIEIIKGLDQDDKVKVWNETVPIKKGDDEENDDE